MISGQADLVAVFQRDDGLFPRVRDASLRGALAAGFATNIQRVDAGDFDLEQFLHGLPDLGLVRARIGHDGVLVILLGLARAFFRQADGLDDFESVHDLFLVETGFDNFKSALGEEQFVGAQHVIGVERIAGGERHAANVAGGTREISIGCTAGNDERGARQFQRVNDLDEIFRLGRGQFQIVHDHHVAHFEAFGQSLAEREGFGVLGNFLREIARARTKGHTTADPHGRLEGTGAGAARAFLLPRFLVRAGDFASVLGFRRAAALRRAIRGDRVVDGLCAATVFDHRELHFEFAGGFAGNVFDGNFHGLIISWRQRLSHQQRLFSCRRSARELSNPSDVSWIHG